VVTQARAFRHCAVRTRSQEFSVPGLARRAVPRFWEVGARRPKRMGLYWPRPSPPYLKREGAMRTPLCGVALLGVLSFGISAWSQQPASQSPSTAKTSPAAGEINACKYLIVKDFDTDPYGIAKQLRAQARSNGFTLIQAATDATPSERLKACVMNGSWERWQYGFGGNVAIRVEDVMSGAVMAEAATEGVAWWSVGRSVRIAVKKLYTQLGYTGYSDAAFNGRMQRVYPTRPKLATSEAQIKSTEPRTALEGIWSDSESKFKLGIVKAPEGSSADYVAVVLESTSPTWQAGEIKAEIRTTASPAVFLCTYFLEDKKPGNTTVTLEDDSVLRGSISTPNGPSELMLVRVWPKATEPMKAASEESRN